MRFWPWSRKSVALGDSEAVRRAILGGQQAKSGAAVTADTALNVTAVLACARVLGLGLAQVPFKMYRRDRTGVAAEERDHPLFAVMQRQANAVQTAFELREQIGLHLALTGNAFVLKLRNAPGQIVELQALRPQAVTVLLEASGAPAGYRYTSAGTQVVFPPSEIWHLRNTAWEMAVGLEPVAMAREAIGLGLATEEFAARLFSNGARPGGILSSDVNLKPEQYEWLRKSWDDMNTGSGNAMRTAILSGGLKWQSLSYTADEAQFIEGRKFIVEEICRAFGVQPIMVMHNDNQAAYASVEQRYIAHYRDTLAPLFRRVEMSATVNLLTKAEQAEGLYFEHDARGLLRGTARERAEFYALMTQNGFMTQNEVRAAENMAPFADPAADAPRLAANLFGPAPLADE